MNQAPVSLLKGLISVLLVVAVTVPARADDKPAGERPSEAQFLLFDFQYLLNYGWPKVDVTVKTVKGCNQKVHVLRIGETAADNPLKIVTGPIIRSFVAQRERVVHDLVDRVKTVDLGDKERNKELVEQMELFMKVLHERGDSLATELDVCGQEMRDKEIEILDTVDRAAAQKKYEAAQHVQATAYFMSQATDDPLVAVFATALVGMAEGARIKREIVTEARASYDTYLADKSSECPLGGGGRTQFYNKTRLVVQGADEKLNQALASERDAATKLTRQVAALNKWPDAETPFVAGAAKAARQTDLLHQVRLVEDEPIETSKGDSAEAESRLEHAAKYARLASLIPFEKNKANNYYRAQLYYLAGVEANRAARLTVGTDGFSAKKPGRAAKLAMRYWLEYKRNNDRDMTGDVLHNYCLALAYNRQAITAFDALKVDSKFFPFGEPEFFYDQARICSVAAEDYKAQLARESAILARQHRRLTIIARNQRQARLHLMYQEASLSLYRAVLFGFKDFERAKNVRDLKAFREAEQSVLGYRLTFEHIVGGS